MSSGDESIDIPDEIEVIEEVEGENDNPIETIETGEETVQNNEAKDSDEEDTKKVVKPKRVVRNPQPKLNEQTLRTKKGLTALPNHFKRVKFKGRGHEAQDLNVLMKTYEYWCHRLYPKFPFDACIAKLETLGTKRGTQVLLKKIRLGMDICDDDRKLVSDEEQEETPMTEGFVDTFDNRFDQLLSGTNGTFRPAGPKTTEEQLRADEPETTEEQLERMRQNKLRAETLRRQRLEKMKANTQNQENPATRSSSRNENSTRGDTRLDEEVDFDNISSSVNKDTENSVQTETSHLNDKSSDEDIVSQKSKGTKRTQVISSDEEEMQVDSEKPTNERSENINNGNVRKKIQTIESDDELEVNSGLDERNGNSRTEDETRSCAMEEDNEEVDLDNILSIVNEDAETLESNKSDGNGTFLNKSSSDEEEKNTSIDNVKENNYTSIRRKKVQTIESSDEMETNDNVTDTSSNDIPKTSDEVDTKSTSAEDNLNR